MERESLFQFRSLLADPDKVRRRAERFVELSVGPAGSLAQDVIMLLDEVEGLRQTVLRAAFVAEHLMQMIDRETWRASGGDDGQGHYEGDYREASTFEEIQAWKAATRA